MFKPEDIKNEGRNCDIYEMDPSIHRSGSLILSDSMKKKIVNLDNIHDDSNKIVSDSYDDTDDFEDVEEKISLEDQAKLDYINIKEHSKSWYAEYVYATMNENINKNRYMNILANDNTRVKLKNDGYINANYMVGGMYISCQAPLLNYLRDFWEMVTENDSPMIVMLTKFMENGKKKADSYLPDESENFGDVKITFFNYVNINSEFVIRTYELEKLDTKRYICHLHFTGWPDFGVPYAPEVVLQLVYTFLYVQLVMRDNYNIRGQPIIHCSAGVGRSGSLLAMLPFFIAYITPSLEISSHFDSTSQYKEIIDHIQTENINLEYSVEIVKKIVTNLRKERSGMVQTEDQYLSIVQTIVTFLDYSLDRVRELKKTKSEIEVLGLLLDETIVSKLDNLFSSIKNN